MAGDLHAAGRDVHVGGDLLGVEIELDVGADAHFVRREPRMPLQEAGVESVVNGVEIFFEQLVVLLVVHVGVDLAQYAPAPILLGELLHLAAQFAQHRVALNAHHGQVDELALAFAQFDPQQLDVVLLLFAFEQPLLLAQQRPALPLHDPFEQEPDGQPQQHGRQKHAGDEPSLQIPRIGYVEK